MEMGFEEMPTNRWVESSFWNFDSLFQPQSHPARDAHDTFFIKDPANTIALPEEYYERVKTMHEIGGSGSIGYRYDFKRGGTWYILSSTIDNSQTDSQFARLGTYNRFFFHGTQNPTSFIYHP